MNVIVTFLTPDLRAPSVDHRETSTHDGKPAEFYNAGPKIRGALPQNKFGGQKHAKFGRFFNVRL